MTRSRRPAALLERVEERPVALSCVALAVAGGASAGMAIVAGPNAVREVLEDVAPLWLAVLVAAQVVSYASYTVAHRWAMMVRGRGELTSGTALRMAAYGAAATSLRGGSRWTGGPCAALAPAAGARACACSGWACSNT